MTSERIAVLPLRDMVVFPRAIIPLFIGRERSVAALEYASLSNPEGRVALVTQKDSIVEEPQIEDIYSIGTESRILQIVHMPDGTAKVIFEGLARTKLTYSMHQQEGKVPFIVATSDSVRNQVTKEQEEEIEIVCQNVRNEFAACVKINRKIPADAMTGLLQTKDPDKLADTICMHLTLSIENRQKVLETFDILERLELILSFIEAESGMVNTDRRVRSRIKSQMEKTQREYYLNEQLKAIYKELGEGEDGKSDINSFEKKIASTDLSAEARSKAISELRKLKAMSPVSSEAIVVRNYLEWLLALPWGTEKKSDIDLEKAEIELNSKHYGLTKVKERIMEYLAVQKRTGSLKGPILCLVGPPGVGKTSLAESIARATGRSFVKASLGGVRDEAEIRGHRRTYIGAMPGKIIQSIKKSGTRAPLFLLDEIDKMSSDFRGDPSSAMLEVLDPEQNSKFVDHYMEVDYDLSDVMFVATANSINNMSRPLVDRMEIIQVSSYTEEEKMHIAQDYIFKKQKTFAGISDDELELSKDAMRNIIRYYTREAGVRRLEQYIAKIARRTVRAILAGKTKKVKISPQNLHKFCGVKQFSYGIVEKKNLVGTSTGLAYTDVGGDILHIESARMEGSGRIKCTGKLGKVMQESAHAAFSYIKSRRKSLGLTIDQLKSVDIHLHVPEGATPKDGPSAGIAICVSIFSALSGRPALCSVAMTGEITLRGNVLPIGGLREKLLAALRSGITTVIIPKENEKDLTEIPENVKRGLIIKVVSRVSEVLDIAIESQSDVSINLDALPHIVGSSNNIENRDVA